MYKTPSFSSLLDFIATTLDLFEGKSRKRVFSELKSFSAKQIYFKDLFSKIKTELKLSASDLNYISNSFIKVENILSNLRSEPIYSNITPEAGERLFLILFAIPFAKQICAKSIDITSNIYFQHLYKFLSPADGRIIDMTNILATVKFEVSRKIEEANIDNKASMELKNKLSKLDTRSFKKVSSIKKDISEFQQNLLAFSDVNTAQNLASTISLILLAAKTAFSIAKNIQGKRTKLSDADENIRKLFLLFSDEYILDKNISDIDDSYINDKNYYRCKKHFFERICQEDPVAYLKENGTRALWQYKNGIFYSYCIREQMYWDINHGRVDETYIKQVINILPMLKERQAGEDATYIAIFIIAMKVKLLDSIPPNTLEPAFNFLIENLAKHTLISFTTLTPFGICISGENLTATQINIALAIRTFNDCVSSGKIKSEYCNPLFYLNILLKTYFKKGGLTKKQRELKPIKTEKTTLYDALKNIEYHILNFELVEKAEFDNLGHYIVQTSHAGEEINQFLILNNSQRQAILKSVNPEEFDIDVRKIN